MTCGDDSGRMSFQRPGWLELSLWALGILLIAVFLSTRVWSEHARSQAVEAFRIRAASPGLEDSRLTAPTGVDQSLWSRARILAYAHSFPVAGAPEAVLRIPSLRLEVPVYRVLNELNLNRGAAHIEGTTDLLRNGNIGIAAHRDGFFRKLKDIEVGADVYLDVERRSTRFHVVKLSIVDPSDTAVLAPTASSMITLVTCYPFYFIGPAPQRFVVQAEADATTDARESSSHRIHPPK